MWFVLCEHSQNSLFAFSYYTLFFRWCTDNEIDPMVAQPLMDDVCFKRRGWVTVWHFSSSHLVCSSPRTNFASIFFLDKAKHTCFYSIFILFFSCIHGCCNLKCGQFVSLGVFSLLLLYGSHPRSQVCIAFKLEFPLANGSFRVSIDYFFFRMSPGVAGKVGGRSGAERYVERPAYTREVPSPGQDV